jgi:cephalosporin-C deacetylase
MAKFQHSYPFDPSYGYSLEDLLRIIPPPVPADFAAFWQRRYQVALTVGPRPVLQPAADIGDAFVVHDISYRSTGGFIICGWLLLPRTGPITRGMVVGHGYGGRNGPDLDVPVTEAAVLFPCFRGLSRSAHAPISSDPAWHVLHDIQDRDRYILGGCVDDLWLGVSALLALYPGLEGHIGYMGSSFGGGIGALALPWEPRIARAHLSLPTFGHYPLRLPLESCGSLASVREFYKFHNNVMDTLQYYDAATAAAFIHVTIHVAAALFDPAVPPPGQFAIYNAVPGEKEIYVLEAGHFDYDRTEIEERLLQRQLQDFFAAL